jgi:hypothetical protein
MKNYPLLCAAAAMLSLAGCSHQYVMKMSNGSKVVSASRPKLENGVYVYKDARGDKHSVSQGRVIEIAPASMASETPGKVKK